jgi:hypothetical protein
MSLKEKLKEREKLDDKELGGVDELILDELVQVSELSKADQEYLQKFEGLRMLSMNGLGLEKLSTLPQLKQLIRVEWLSLKWLVRAERQQAQRHPRTGAICPFGKT